MASLDDEIDTLREAIVAGVKRVRSRVNGVEKEVEYPSFDDMRRRLDWLEAQRCGTRPRVGLAAFGRGDR